MQQICVIQIQSKKQKTSVFWKNGMAVTKQENNNSLLLTSPAGGAQKPANMN